jgi:hypothetical protein
LVDAHPREQEVLVVVVEDVKIVVGASALALRFADGERFAAPSAMLRCR